MITRSLNATVPAVLVDCPVKVSPPPGSLQVGLVDEPSIARGVAAWSRSLYELRSEPLRPPEDGDVIDHDASLGQQFLDVPIDRPYRRYQRTASEITSGGNRKPAKTETVRGEVTGSAFHCT
jgi:hypothetical protein